MVYKGDAYYIREVLGGSTGAYTYIVNRHKDNAFNLAFRICGNREDAEEIAQDAFMKAFRALGDYRFKAGFATWLYRIVYNTSVSYLRTRRGEIISLEEFPSDASAFLGRTDTEEEAVREHRNELVNYALKKLNAEERALITLYYYEEMSTEEISKVTSITRENVKIRLFRARRKMLETIRDVEMKNEEVYNA
jgi:RNA polymerase sigma-70 factor (ECF subfamily)